METTCPWPHIIWQLGLKKVKSMCCDKRTNHSYPARSTCRTTVLRPNVISSMRVCKCSKSPSNSSVYQHNKYGTWYWQGSLSPSSLSNLFVYRISWRGLYFPRLLLSRTPGNITRADKQWLQRIFDTRCCAVMRPIVRLFETANLRKKTWRLGLCLTWKRLRMYWRAYCGLRCNFAGSILAIHWYNSCGVRLVKSTDGMMKGRLHSILANLATRGTVHIHTFADTKAPSNTSSRCITSSIERSVTQPLIWNARGEISACQGVCHGCAQMHQSSSCETSVAQWQESQRGTTSRPSTPTLRLSLPASETLLNLKLTLARTR